MPPTSITLAGCSSNNSGCITSRFICRTNCDCVFHCQWCEWWRSKDETPNTQLPPLDGEPGLGRPFCASFTIWLEPTATLQSILDAAPLAQKLGIGSHF